MVVGPAILDDDILALSEAGLAQALANGRQDPLPRGRRRAAEKADDRDDIALLVAPGTVAAAKAAMVATRTIPIVLYSGAPKVRRPSNGIIGVPSRKPDHPAVKEKAGPREPAGSLASPK